MSTKQPLAHPENSRPRNPSIEVIEGEDPNRFLHREGTALALARIRGIDTVSLVRAWAAVERSEYGGRPVILDALDAREAELTEAADE